MSLYLGVDHAETPHQSREQIQDRYFVGLHRQIHESQRLSCLNMCKEYVDESLAGHYIAADQHSYLMDEIRLKNQELALSRFKEMLRVLFNSEALDATITLSESRVNREKPSAIIEVYNQETQNKLIQVVRRALDETPELHRMKIAANVGIKIRRVKNIQADKNVVLAA